MAIGTRLCVKGIYNLAPAP